MKTKIIVCYIKRVLFGLSSSSFLLSSGLTHRAHNYESVLQFIKSLHVDDLVSTDNSLKEVEDY